MLLPLLLAGCAVTAPEPGKEGYLAGCIDERSERILAEWARHESVMAHRIVHPDWRSQSRRWAAIECNRGQPVAAFHPENSAVARRVY